MRSSRLGVIGCLLTVVAILGIGCGGDSETTPPAPLSEASLNGTYSYADYYQNTSSTTATLAIMTYDGAGNVDLTVSSGGTSTTYSGTYTLVADGSLTMTINGGSINGKVAGDATQILVADNASAAGVEGTIGILTKMGSAYTTASLSGDYVASIIETDTGTVSSYWVGLTFDGIGGVDVSVSSGGVTSTVPATYTVAADGSVVVAGNPGRLSADGNVLAFADDDGASNADLTVAVKGGAGHTAATVAGVYHFGEFTYTTANGPSSGMGAMTLNADGTLTVSVTIAPGTTLSKTGTFSVTDPSGVLSFTVDGNTQVGAVSADGQTILYSDLVADASPEICIAIKK